MIGSHDPKLPRQGNCAALPAGTGQAVLGRVLVRSALRKLLLLDAAESLEDLRVPPGNRLEKLGGDRLGQYSIRVNERWRICFRWTEGNADDVEITDYH